MATYDLAYPGAAIDAILNTAYYLQEAGFIFRGSASEYSGTPSKREWVIAPAGFTGYGISSPVPQGSIGICLYNGTSWVGKIINVATIDSTPTQNSGNAVSSGGAYAAINQLSANVTEALENLTFTDTTPSAFQDEYVNFKVSTTEGGVEHILTYLTILAATTEKAGLMSAEDKAKVNSFLTGILSMRFVDATTSAEQSIKLVEQLKWTVGGVQEVIDSITILAATSSKAGLLSASDKAYIDALPSALTSLSNSISAALALMESLVGYYVCDTAAATAAKTVAATGYSLTNGGCIRIKMTNANTAANVTLNINSTGAKALYYDGAQASSTNTWEAGEVLEVYYDGTQYQCASGGGGKFATGQKVKETYITNEVINNSDALPTSGAVNKAINEGKTFGEKVIPIPSIERKYKLGSDGVYSGSYSARKVMHVEGGLTYKIVGNPSYNSLAAFLTASDIDAASGSSASLTSDGTIYEIIAGATYYLKAPLDAQYLVFNAAENTNNPNTKYYTQPSSVSQMLNMAYLNEKIEKDEEPYYQSDTEIDVSTFVANNYNFNDNGSYSGAGSTKHYRLTIKAGCQYTISADDNAINIGWLKSTAASVTGKPADLSLYDGKVYVLEPHSTITIESPKDAVEMICSIVPASVFVHTIWTYNEQVEKNTEDIEELRSDVDMLKVPLIMVPIPSSTVRYYLRDDGKWGGNSLAKHVYIPVTPGTKYRITGTSDYGNNCAFLTEMPSAPVTNTNAPITSDGKVYSFANGQSVDATAPEDAVCLVVNTVYEQSGTTHEVTPEVGEVLPLDEYLETEKYPESIFDLNPDWMIRNLIIQSGRELNLNQSGTNGVDPLVIIHLSDIHGDKKSWDRMIDFKKRYTAYIDDAICTGDIISGLFADNKEFLENGGDQVMLCLGNHDVAKTAWNILDATAQECYEGFFAPYISSWNVNYQTNKCYYYKDYATQKIRMIVLDTNIGANDNNEHWNATQLAWLQSTLESARTNAYSVIIAQHYWAVNSSGRTYVDCTFTCKTPLGEGETIIPTDARDAVQSFIDAGGTFICWLSGHTHRDFVYYPTANPKQLGIVVDCAAGYNSAIVVCDEARVAGSKSIDAFNIIAFDTTRKIIKIVRIGSDTDSLMRHKGVLTIKYGGDIPEVIFNN